jgi:ADP-ribose pyrophosphatase YjhB (NUDIX family)
MNTNVNKQIEYPTAIDGLLQKYPKTPVVQISELMDVEHFQKQKRKQLQYPIEGAALGIVVIAARKIILTKRTAPHVPHPGWALPGGRVELGEHFDDALRREVEEECGISVAISNAVLIEDKTFISSEGEKLQFWITIFTAFNTSSGGPYQTEEASREGLEIKVVSIDNLPEDMPLQEKQKIMRYLS